MLDDVHWKEVVKQSKHRKAIGQTEYSIWSSKDPLDRPWQYASRVEPGGTYRCNTPVNVYVLADHPCGITFRWCVEMERRNSDGKTGLQFDIDGITKLSALMPKNLRPQFATMLAPAIAEAEKTANEYQTIATQQFASAALLRDMSERLSRSK